MSEKKLKTLTPGQYAFMKWLGEAHPEVLAAAEERRASLSGFMDSLTNVFDNVMQKAPELMKQYVDGKAQLAQLKLNIERAKQGQYPIESPLYAAAQTQTKSAPVWVWAGLAAAAVYLLTRK